MKTTARCRPMMMNGAADVMTITIAKHHVRNTTCSLRFYTAVQ